MKKDWKEGDSFIFNAKTKFGQHGTSIPHGAVVTIEIVIDRGELYLDAYYTWDNRQSRARDALPWEAFQPISEVTAPRSRKTAYVSTRPTLFELSEMQEAQKRERGDL